MKKHLILFAFVMLALSSCKTREKIVYFQDINIEQAVPTQMRSTLRLEPGDKLGITVTSTATP